MEDKIYVGVDLAVKLKWWQRALVWLGFRNRWTDKSCMAVFRKDEKGNYFMKDCNYF